IVSSAPAVDLAGGVSTDVALRHVIPHRCQCSSLGVAIAATAGLDNGEARARCHLVAALGVHRLAIDGMHSGRAGLSGKHAPRREHGAVAHAESDEGMPGVVAHDDLLAQTPAPLTGAARIGEELLALDGGKIGRAACRERAEAWE